MQGELKSTIEESKLVQEKYKVLLEQVRKELTNKHHECEDLKSQVLRLYYTIDVVEYICTCVISTPSRHCKFNLLGHVGN